MQRFYHTHRSEDNALATVINLCAIMGVKISHARMASALRGHPHYPSFAAISDVLENYNLETLAINLPALQPDAIPLPAIAHLHTRQGQFVVLRYIDKHVVQYVHAEHGIVREPIDKFQNKWSGNILLVSANESPENNNVSHQPPEHATPRHSYARYGVIALALLCMFKWTGFDAESTVYRALYFISLIAGTGISLLLAALQQGSGGGVGSRFCRQTEPGGCRDVLNSKAARIAGISLADIGVVYFTGTALVFLFGDITGQPQVFGSYLWLVSLTALPFPIFSVAYQKFKLSAWCPLCLCVCALIVAQAMLLTRYCAHIYMDWNALPMFLSGYLLVAGSWPVLKSLYKRSLQAEDFKQTALSLKQNPSIIATLLREQTDIPLTTLEHDIILGNPEASFTITLVINPECAPCKTVYTQMEKLLSRFRTRLRVILRFAGMVDHASPLALYFIQLSLKDIRQAEAALSAWFNTQQTPEGLIQALRNPNIAHAKNIHLEHLRWAKRAGITTTPFCILNTKPLPHQLELTDLEIYLKEILPANHRSPARSSHPRAARTSQPISTLKPNLS